MINITRWILVSIVTETNLNQASIWGGHYIGDERISHCGVKMRYRSGKTYV